MSFDSISTILGDVHSFDRLFRFDVSLSADLDSWLRFLLTRRTYSGRDRFRPLSGGDDSISSNARLRDRPEKGEGDLDLCASIVVDINMEDERTE